MTFAWIYLCNTRIELHLRFKWLLCSSNADFLRKYYIRKCYIMVLLLCQWLQPAFLIFSIYPHRSKRSATCAPTLLPKNMCKFSHCQLFINQKKQTKENPKFCFRRSASDYTLCCCCLASLVKFTNFICQLIFKWLNSTILLSLLLLLRKRNQTKSKLNQNEKPFSKKKKRTKTLPTTIDDTPIVVIAR